MWGVRVLDRYSLVLHIFRTNARTREAKLQISLAEIPLLRFKHLLGKKGGMEEPPPSFPSNRPSFSPCISAGHV